MVLAILPASSSVPPSPPSSIRPRSPPSPHATGAGASPAPLAVAIRRPSRLSTLAISASPQRTAILRMIHAASDRQEPLPTAPHPAPSGLDRPPDVPRPRRQHCSLAYHETSSPKTVARRVGYGTNDRCWTPTIAAGVAEAKGSLRLHRGCESGLRADRREPEAALLPGAFSAPRNRRGQRHGKGTTPPNPRAARAFAALAAQRTRWPWRAQLVHPCVPCGGG
jgi:hypothetical protein